MRTSAGICAALAAAMLLAGQAHAQKYPVKRIRLIVGHAPGGGSDIMARLIGPQITEALGQQVVVENRPGAAQNVASEYIIKQPADGYTLFLSSAALGVNISLYPKLNYHPQRDFVPIAVFATSPNLLLVHPSYPAKTLKEFVAVAKRNPGKLNFSSSGSGSAQHLTGELLKIYVGVDMTHIPYKGMGAAYADLIAGNIELSFPTIVSSQAHIRAGRLRALAVTGPKRAPAMPEVPTMSEAGIQGVVVTNWYGILAPAGTPRPIIDRLNKEIVNALRQPEMMKRLIGEGSEAMGTSPQEFAAHIRAEHDQWARVIKQAGITGK